MSAAKPWRDRIGVHPAADLFPMMADDELDALAADIKKHGLRSPVVLLDRAVLDGRNRLEAAERAGIELFKSDGSPIWAYFKSFGGYNKFDPLAFVVSANIHRRHLTTEKKRELIAALLKARPERSDRATAAISKVSPSTVGAIRQNLERTGDVSKLDTRTDTAGRQQPAARPPKAPSKADQLRALREQQVTRSAASTRAPAPQGPEHYGVVDELESILRTVRGDRTRLAMLSHEKRVDLVKRLMSFLRVDLGDLGAAGGVS